MCDYFHYYLFPKNTTKIEYLNLSHNQFAETAGMVLGPAIAENSSIKELDLSWNSLRRRGATAVAQGIKVSTQSNHSVISKIHILFPLMSPAAADIKQNLKLNSEKI